MLRERQVKLGGTTGGWVLPKRPLGDACGRSTTSMLGEALAVMFRFRAEHVAALLGEPSSVLADSCCRLCSGEQRECNILN